MAISGAIVRLHHAHLCSDQSSPTPKDGTRTPERDGDGNGRRRIVGEEASRGTKKKFRRSDSGDGSQRSSSSSFIKSQSLAMKQYHPLTASNQQQNHSSLGSNNSLSDSSDDEGEQDHAGLGIGSKKHPKSLEMYKKRRRTIESDSSDDSDDSDDDEIHRKKRPTGESITSKETGNSMKDPKHKKRSMAKLRPMKDGENASNYSDQQPSSFPPAKKKKSKDSARGAPKRKYGRGSPRKAAEEDTFSLENEGPHYKILSKKDLKPRLKVGDEVYAAWWPDAESRRTNSSSSWYPGRIKSAKEVDSGGIYGPTRFYDIEYDDGDELFLVGDVFVFPTFDYLLATRVDERTKRSQKWIGLKHVVDANSSDEYAKVIGWYTAAIDGEVHSFPLLSDALRAYDNSVVRRKGSRTKPPDLNLSEEWEFSSPKEEHASSDVPSGDQSMSISDLKGFYFHDGSYNAQIKTGGYVHHLGYYKLASDAALAYDNARKLLRCPSFVKANFATEQEHMNLRALELRRTGLNVDFESVQAYMSSRLNSIATKVAASADDSNLDCDGLPEAKRIKKKKSSDYVGVTYCKRQKYFKSYIGRKYKHINISYYALETDAALSYDFAARLLRGQGSKTNFVTLQDYEKAKKRELDVTGFSVDVTTSSTAIESTVKYILLKHSITVDGTDHSLKESATPTTCPEIIALNAAMKKKWSSYLPSTSGAKFLDDYQRSINDILQGLKPSSKTDDALVPSTVSVGNDLSDASLTNKDPKGHNAGPNRHSRDVDPIVTTSYVGTALAAAQNANGVTSCGGNEFDVSLDDPAFELTKESAQKLNTHSNTPMPSSRTTCDNAQVNQVPDSSRTTKASNGLNRLQIQPRDEIPEVSTSGVRKPTNEPSSQKSNMPSPFISTRATCEISQPKPDKKAPLLSMNSSKQSSTTRSIVSTRNTRDLIQFTIDQVEQMELPYPVGCPVWFQYEKINTAIGNHGSSDSSGQSFRTGVVTAAFLDRSAQNILYQVKLAGVDQTELLPQNHLCYAPCTTVSISPFSPGNPLPGEVLMCRVIDTMSHQDVTIQTVLQLKDSLLKEQDLSNTQGGNGKLLDTLGKLGKIDMSRPVLVETRIGKCVNKLAKSHGNSLVSDKARELVQRWRDNAGKIQAEAEKEQTGSQDNTDVFIYTVLVVKEGNQIYVEESVLSDRVTYRKVAGASAEENESSNSTITTATGLC